MDTALEVMLTEASMTPPAVVPAGTLMVSDGVPDAGRNENTTP